MYLSERKDPKKKGGWFFALSLLSEEQREQRLVEANSDGVSLAVNACRLKQQFLEHLTKKKCRNVVYLCALAELLRTTSARRPQAMCEKEVMPCIAYAHTGSLQSIMWCSSSSF